MRDKRREGDNRPLVKDPRVSLTWKPAHDEPFRWLPRHGAPLCIAEWFSQSVIKFVAYLPVYTALVVTITLLVVIFGIPFIGGK